MANHVIAQSPTVDPTISELFLKGGRNLQLPVLVTYRSDHAASIFSNLGPVQTQVRLSYIESQGTTRLPSSGIYFWRAHSSGFASALVDQDGISYLKNDPYIETIDYDPPGQTFDNGINDITGASALHTFPTPNLKGQGKVIAIIDTGFDELHPAFASRIVKRECFVSGNNRCPNGQLRQSYEPSTPCTSNTPQNCPLLNRNEPNWNMAPTTGVNHGTAVAALAASSGGGLDPGAAPGVELILINIGAPSNSGTPQFDNDGLYQALEWLQTQDVDVVNMSIGTVSPTHTNTNSNCDQISPRNIVYDMHFEQLISRGVSLVAATGNSSQNNRIASPACNSKVVSVGASFANVQPPGPCGNMSNPNDCLDPVSSRSSVMTTVAPASPILIANATVFGSSPPSTGGSTATSWASPITAGCVATVMQAVEQASLQLEPLALKGIFSASPNHVTDQTNTRSYPRLNCLDAVQQGTSGFSLTIGNPALSGLWYEAVSSGQGFFWEMNINNISDYFFGIWYTFTGSINYTPSGQRWYSIQPAGALDRNAKEIPVTIYRPSDLTFRELGTADLLTVGSGRIYFTSCSSAVFEYTITDTLLGLPTLTGFVPLTRVTTNSSCVEGSVTPAPPPQGVPQPAQRALSGSWFKQDEVGQGFVIDVGDDLDANGNPNGLLNAGWFTFRGSSGSASPSEQRWFTLQGGSYNQMNQTWEAEIYQSVGGVFDTPGTYAATEGTVFAGSATVKFHSCTCATLSYDFVSFLNNPGIQGSSGSIILSRVGPPPQQCTSFTNSPPLGCL